MTDLDRLVIASVLLLSVVLCWLLLTWESKR